MKYKWLPSPGEIRYCVKYISHDGEEVFRYLTEQVQAERAGYMTRSQYRYGRAVMTCKEMWATSGFLVTDLRLIADVDSPAAIAKATEILP